MFLLFLIPLVVCDLAVEPNASTISIGNFKIAWVVTPRNTIIFNINQSAYGHFGISYIPTMTNSDMTIVQIDNGVVKVRDYWSTSHRKPLVDTNNDITVLGAETDNKSYVRVKYQRPLATNDSQDNEIKIGQTRNFSLAWRETPLLANHRANLLYFSGKMQNNTKAIVGDTTEIRAGSGMSSTRRLILVHGILLTLMWCLLADIAIYLTIYRHNWCCMILHGLLMLVCLIISLIFALLLVRKKGGFATFDQLNNIEKAHFIMGVIVFIWAGIQVFSGLAARLFQSYSRIPPWMVRLSTYFHRISGYILVLIGKATVLMGWWAFSSVAFWIVLAWCILTFLFYLYKTLAYPRLSTISKSSRSLMYPLESQAEMAKLASLSMHPYNSPQLTNLDYVIFRDYVWNYSKSGWIHPGGLQLLRMARNREVDRYIYGMYPLQGSKISHEHSKYAVESLGKPIFKLIQLMEVYPDMPDEAYYKISFSEQFSPNHFLLYLQPQQNRLTFKPPTTIDYLGQYYTVRAFGVSRLYTTVHSMNQDNKTLVSSVLRVLGYNIQQASAFYSQKDLGSDSTPRFLLNTDTSHKTPLLIKKYADGKLTNKMLQNMQTTQLLVSHPMGRGLCLGRIRRGKIAILCGGTGFYPFADLIDLLFKKTVLSRGQSNFNQQILSISPSLYNSSHLDGFQFLLFAAVESLGDIHPVHLSMIDFVAKTNPGLLKPFFRVRNQAQISTYNGIQFINDRFDEQLLRKYYLLEPSVSMIYVCGPPKMNYGLSKTFQKLKIPDNAVYYV